MSNSPRQWKPSAQAKVPCKFCGEPMPKNGWCQCRRHRGREPTQAQGPDGEHGSVEEGPGKAPLYEGIAAVVVGAMLSIAGFAGGGLGLALFGLLCVAAGLATLIITKKGTVWQGLQPSQRAAAWPGRIIGWAPAVLVALLFRLLCANIDANVDAISDEIENAKKLTRHLLR